MSLVRCSFFFIVYFIYKANNMCPNFAFSESLTNQTANI